MSHTGPVRIEFHRGWVYVKCPVGHLVTARKLDPSWAGSAMESRITQHRHDGSWVETCDGAVGPVEFGVGTPVSTGTPVCEPTLSGSDPRGFPFS